MKKQNTMQSLKIKNIWIDLDNSPHVPFFKPIITKLNEQGYNVVLSARDCFQVVGMANLYKFNYKKIGRHYGKNKILKIIGTLIRSIQLIPFALKQKPILAISHGSRAQLITATILRIPNIWIFDYEYIQTLGFIKPTWTMAPEIIGEKIPEKRKANFLKYKGLKEDVYVIDFHPDNTFRDKLNLNKEDFVVTIRPPATEAHYHNPYSEKLFSAIVEFLGDIPNIRMVILPRNEKTQKSFIKMSWPEWCKSGKIIIPDQVVNGLDMIWYSEFVISGGGTMNREAAALGVPVYSIFQGKIGAIDKYLSDNGRLVLIKTIEDVSKLIKLTRRDRDNDDFSKNREALKQITENIFYAINNI